MRKISVFILSLIMAITMNVVAQDKPAPADSDKDKKTEPNYMMIGMQVPFLYFIKAKDSSLNYGLLFKAPVAKDFGVEMALNTIVMPIKSYEAPSGTTYSGFGEEEYTNYRLDFLYFLKQHRNLQFKFGFDYYKYVSGYIASVPGMSAEGCGQLYTECKNCREDQYGLNLGANLDVPIYKDFYAMTSLGYRYLLSKHDSAKAGIIDFTIGMGYKLK